ncbi:hypothetical protein KUTeg_000903 [Tegillarca granosa]|uniref:glutamine synthetase n=1 Tax=Tegillarca granosa TaxID=220873 RepID=A0ABQ9FWB9_TEGGR|nr:hypothetical protein KUTeg_000903 [Tegillarca granosa]
MSDKCPPSPYGAYGTNAFDIPYPDDKVLVEYVFLNHTRHRVHSKTRVLDYEPQKAEDCPLWDVYMFKTFEGVEPRKEMILKPVAMYRDPFRRGRNKIALCELWETMEKPAGVNTRRSCAELLKKVEEEGVWFGMEQEYFIMGDNGLPLNWDKDPKAINLNFHTGVGLCKTAGYERELAEFHFQACLYAGLKMYGINREDSPSQWEYQIGPCEGIDLADQIVISRYLLWRTGEFYGVEISMDTKPAVSPENAPNQSNGGHMNFSTTRMRKEGGIKYINEAVEILRNSPQVMSHYDLHGGKDNAKRLTNAYFVPGMDFTTGIGDKYSSVRIPTLVALQGKGYLEDRRPCANADPYEVCETLTRTLLCS